WTRDLLEKDNGNGLNSNPWDYLGSQKMRLTIKKRLGDITAHLDFVHASPRKPINEYVFPDDVYTAPGKINALFEKVKHICFIGHTHLPGVFLEDPDFYTPDELGDVYPIIEGEKAIINVGSVGQPRDRDNRASYVYIEEDKANFVRLEYDYEATAKKIYQVEELDNFEGDRLYEGK
ncbi:MAG: metallophosphoesterase family protein, partial [Sedimentisphaerales bacterium]|nr:metallophosphoesterase family protein [Sedimentisphaerales bacterium]